jgi:hypothetical protein
MKFTIYKKKSFFQCLIVSFLIILMCGLENFSFYFDGMNSENNNFLNRSFESINVSNLSESYVNFHMNSNVFLWYRKFNTY